MNTVDHREDVFNASTYYLFGSSKLGPADCVLELSNTINPTEAAASNSALKFILNDWNGEAALRHQIG